jgi:hypothetical protein
MHTGYTARCHVLLYSDVDTAHFLFFPLKGSELNVEVKACTITLSILSTHTQQHTNILMPDEDYLQVFSVQKRKPSGQSFLKWT